MMHAELPASDMPPKVLVVDDDERVLALHARILARDGFEVETARNGAAAIAALHQSTFDVVLSDVEMPGMSGIHLIDEVRRHDIDVPIIVITGAPTMETAIQALDRGALRYLTKPAGADDLVKAVRDAVRLHRIATAKRQALALAGRNGIFAGDLAGLTVSFERALTSVALAFQPIVSCSSRRVVAYEALMRSHEPGLPSPHAILDAAERLDRVHELGRRLRYLCTQAITAIPEPARLFINVHPLELLDDDLLDGDSLLSVWAPRVTIEITERASLESVRDARGRTRAVRSLGFQLALDDFGAGFGGLTSFVLLEPDVVKIDMQLIRGIEREPMKHSLVKTMAQMCQELGVAVVAEGVETAAERDRLIEAGCDLMQGHLFARPAAVPGQVAW